MSADKRSVRIQGSPIDHSWLVVMRCKRTNGKSCENQLRGRDRSTCRICVPNNWTATEKALFRPDLLEGEEKAVVTTQNLEGEVTAFRGWHLGFDGQSYSLVSDYLLDPAYWTPGQPLKAQCHRRLGDDDHEPRSHDRLLRPPARRQSAPRLSSPRLASPRLELGSSSW